MNELLALVQLSRSTYYHHENRKETKDKFISVKEAMVEIHHKHHGRYGYRRMTAELKRQGYPINHRTVARLIREIGLYCRVRMKEYNSYRGEVGKKIPNLLDRDFVSDAPNQKWATDITEFHLFGKKIFLSPIIDLYNGEIVSYSVSDHPRFSCVMDMPEKRS